MNLVEQALIEHWGERCPEYESGCIACQAWKDYDDLVNHELTHAQVRRNLMLEEMTRPPKDPEMQKAILELIMRKHVKPNHEELLKNLLIAIAKDRDAIRIMATKKEMAEAVAAMKHLWE
jgi:hypothetical protein